MSQAPRATLWSNEDQISPPIIVEQDNTREDLLTMIKEEFHTLTQSLLPSVPSPTISAPSISAQVTQGLLLMSNCKNCLQDSMTSP